MNSTWSRRMLILAALLLTLWVVWDIRQPEVIAQKIFESSGASARRELKKQQKPTTSAVSDSLDFPTRREDVSPVPDLFAIRKPAEVRDVAAIEPVIPVVPALPYAYLGRFEDAGKNLIFLAQGNATLVVGAGTKLSGGWRLESIESGALVFVFEPLKHKQLLQIRDR